MSKNKDLKDKINSFLEQFEQSFLQENNDKISSTQNIKDVIVKLVLTLTQPRYRLTRTLYQNGNAELVDCVFIPIIKQEVLRIIYNDIKYGHLKYTDWEIRLTNLPNHGIYWLDFDYNIFHINQNECDWVQIPLNVYDKFNVQPYDKEFMFLNTLIEQEVEPKGYYSYVYVDACKTVPNFEVNVHLENKPHLFKELYDYDYEKYLGK